MALTANYVVRSFKILIKELVPAYVNLNIVMYVVDFFFQAEDGIRDIGVTGVQTCALPIWSSSRSRDGCATPSRGAEHGTHAPGRHRPPSPGRAAGVVAGQSRDAGRRAVDYS